MKYVLVKVAGCSNSTCSFYGLSIGTVVWFWNSTYSNINEAMQRAEVYNKEYSACKCRVEVKEEQG